MNPPKPNPLLMKLIQNCDARFWLVLRGSLFDLTQILQTNIDFISKTYILLPLLSRSQTRFVCFFFKDIDFQQKFFLFPLMDTTSELSSSMVRLNIGNNKLSFIRICLLERIFCCLEDETFAKWYHKYYTMSCNWDGASFSSYQISQF